jgi:serine/threonine protein kinase
MTDPVRRKLGRFQILDELGRGGMAIVYRAHDPKLDRIVAIKEILSEGEPSEAFLQRFHQEALALAQLSHDNIVRIFDQGDENGQPYLVMEYVPGGSLKEKLTKPMPWQEAVRLVIPIAHALSYIHQHHIIHRDIKPNNILLTEAGKPMLSDFGIAKILETVQTTVLKTSTGAWIGTPAYMAPEQMTSQSVDARADIYALGIMLYGMISGRQPYEARTPAGLLGEKLKGPPASLHEFVPDLPPYVEYILSRCIQVNPEDRYPTADDLASDLERSITAVAPPLPKRTSVHPVHYRSWAIGLIPLALLTFGCAGAILLWMKGGLAPHTTSTATIPTTQGSILQSEVTALPATSTPQFPTDTAMPPSPPTDGMIFISGGEFTMGSPGTDREADADEKPQHQVTVGPFWMDGYEVTVSAYRRCVRGGICHPVELRSDDVPANYFSDPMYDSYPVVDVSWQDASTFCEWRSGRLPTEAEWELAAGGVDHFVYPWGNEAAGLMNFCDLNCPLDVQNASFDDGYAYRAPVDSYPEGRSPYGLYNMLGNVWEWVADWYAENYYAHSPVKNPTGPASGTERVARGAGWDSLLKNARVTNRLHLSPTSYLTGSLGFRCAMDEQP